MCPARTTVIACLLSGLLSASLCAQSRKPLAGVVTGPDGKGLGGAVVTLTWAPDGEGDAANYDVVQVTADGSGRFKANLLPCASYIAWAAGPPTDDGKHVVSAVVMTAVGRVLELQATHAAPPRKIAISGLGAWSDLAPFKIACQPTLGAAPVLVDVGSADVELPLPLLPHGAAHVDLLTKDGETLATSYLMNAHDDGVASFGVLPPQTVPMLVVDDQGKPVADAEILHRSAERHVRSEPGAMSPPGVQRWRRLGRTDKEGRLQARIPEAREPLQHEGWQDLAFVATRPGFAASHSGFTHQPYCDGAQVKREGLKELRFVLRKEQPLRGRLLLAPDQPAAGIALHLTGDTRISELDGNGWSSRTWNWRAVTGADGRFSIADLPIGVEALSMLVGPGVPLAPTERPRSAPPCPFALWSIDARPTDELVIDLSALKTVDLQLLTPDQTPATAAHIALLPASRDNVRTQSVPRHVPDGLGRLSLRVQPGEWLLFACDGVAFAMRELKVASDLQEKVQLDALPAMRGTVRDAEGKPVAGAVLNCHGSSWGFEADRSQRVLSQVAGALNWQFFHAVRTAEDGTYVAPYLARKNMSYRGVFRFGDRQSERFTFSVDDDPIDVVIQ